MNPVRWIACALIAAVDRLTACKDCPPPAVEVPPLTTPGNPKPAPAPADPREIWRAPSHRWRGDRVFQKCVRAGCNVERFRNEAGTIAYRDGTDAPWSSYYKPCRREVSPPPDDVSRSTGG